MTGAAHRVDVRQRAAVLFGVTLTRRLPRTLSSGHLYERVVEAIHLGRDAEQNGGPLPNVNTVSRPSHAVAGRNA